MTPDRWRKVKETLASAMERETTTDRAQFLSETCADDTALRREVESLLSQSAGALDSWADGGGFIGSDPAGSQNEGRRIGPYQLVHELGRGGMGTVWLARRADERFEQQVAIKLLKRGTDTEEVLRRFASERKILARLEHSGIARLFDGGETSDGLPFFVMEFVAGERLTTYAKEHKLSVPARLELFRKVCAAVQFAHQNLVVHRDLKPGNILVTAEGEPKLLDFGIARLLDEAAPDVTALDHRRLTPAYASPEQARGEPITTASDIYTLGALLYELLTEQSPHAFTSTKPSNTELIRVIAEQDPRRPSLVAEDAETRRRLRGDLDNIVLRAMAREPARRYASANGLSDDLACHLANRPVRARPDTFGYRTGKFVRRNKVGVTAGALLTVALAAGVIATAFQARRVERRFSEVRRLTNSYLFEIHDAIHDLPGATSARQLIVTRALEFLDRLAGESAGDRTLQLELAAAYLKVGDVQGKPYKPNLGDSTGAVRSYTKAADIAAPLAEAETDSHSTARRILSQAEESLGRSGITFESLAGGDASPSPRLVDSPEIAARRSGRRGRMAARDGGQSSRPGRRARECAPLPTGPRGANRRAGKFPARPADQRENSRPDIPRAGRTLFSSREFARASLPSNRISGPHKMILRPTARRRSSTNAPLRSMKQCCAPIPPAPRCNATWRMH